MHPRRLGLRLTGKFWVSDAYQFHEYVLSTTEESLPRSPPLRRSRGCCGRPVLDRCARPALAIHYLRFLGRVGRSQYQNRASVTIQMSRFASDVSGFSFPSSSPPPSQAILAPVARVPMLRTRLRRTRLFFFFALTASPARAHQDPGGSPTAEQQPPSAPCQEAPPKQETRPYPVKPLHTLHRALPQHTPTPATRLLHRDKPPPRLYPFAFYRLLLSQCMTIVLLASWCR